MLGFLKEEKKKKRDFFSIWVW